MRSKELKIVEELHPNLSIRSGAKLFFDQVNTIPESEISINFEGSEFISRSFAQEYIKQKRNSNKQIKEVKMPENIRSMIELVENSPTPNVKEILKQLDKN